MEDVIEDGDSDYGSDFTADEEAILTGLLTQLPLRPHSSQPRQPAEHHHAEEQNVPVARVLGRVSRGQAGVATSGVALGQDDKEVSKLAVNDGQISEKWGHMG